MDSIAELIAHPQSLNKDTLYGLRELVAKYPYHQAARLLFLHNLFLLHDPTFGEELRKASILLPDRRVLFERVESDNYKIQPTPLHTEEEAERKGDRTQWLIDDFLRTANDAEDSVPRKGRKLTAADATTDYAAFLLQMEDAVPASADNKDEGTDRSAALIDDFIENTPERIQLQENPEYVPEVSDTGDEASDTAADEGYLTMTLAKIYIKQQRYEKALEIIRKVNLNNPKKSSYFADQIRFLQKLIVNKKHEKE